MKKFKIKLKKVHDATGLTRYAVAKQTGLSQSTVGKYVVESEVVADYLPPQVIDLAEFYGVDWRDSSIIEVFEESDGESAPEIKTPALVPTF